MKEIEVKIIEFNAKDLEAKLAKLGAEKVFEGKLEWTIFDFPDRRFSNQEILLRLRKAGDGTELTLKKLINTDQSKVSEEFEVNVNDFDTMKRILTELGLGERRGYPLTKHRISYVLNDIHFEIDTLPQFPTYLEIEGPSYEVIEQAALELDFKKEDIKPWGTREVFAHYRNLGNKF